MPVLKYKIDSHVIPTICPDLGVTGVLCPVRRPCGD